MKPFNPQLKTFESFIRPHIFEMESYTPILPLDVLSEQLDIPIEKIIKLDANENPYGALPEVGEALAKLPFTHIYPDPESRQLRRAISKTTGAPFENILAGAGADELIDLIMRLLLDPGDCILNCPPTFGMYSFDAGINNAAVVSVPRNPNFELDLDEIFKAVEKFKPKLVFLASPNNPDGTLLPDEIIDALLELPIIVVLDEAYIDFAPPGTSCIQKEAKNNNLIILRTFSKWPGLAGMRIGYGVFPSWMMPHLWKIKQPYNVSVASATAAIVSLEKIDQLHARTNLIITERDRLFKSLSEIPWINPYPSQANFILCKVIGKDASRLKADLARRGILIRYFKKPGLQDHIRISIGKPEQTDKLLVELERLKPHV